MAKPSKTYQSQNSLLSAISDEETDGRIYADFAVRLRRQLSGDCSGLQRNGGARKTLAGADYMRLSRRYP